MRTYEENRAETERLLALLPEVTDQLMRIPGVTDVAVGARQRGGETIEEFVFQVRVVEKLPPEQIPPGELVPPEIAGVPTDVIVQPMRRLEVGFNDENDSNEYSPLVGGVHLEGESHSGIGTLGVLCRRTSDSKVVFLTNWHVLIDPDGAIGDGVGHPTWRSSCCCTCGKIGKITAFDKTLDCAIGELDSDVTFAPKIRRIKKTDGTVELSGAISGSAPAAVLDEVWKVGARTGLTRGQVTAVTAEEVTIKPLAPFTRMSDHGDSGAVHVNLSTGNVCALHYAGDGTNAFGKPIEAVRAKLGIEVIPTDPAGDYQVSDWIESDAPVPVIEPYAAVAERLRGSAAGRELLHLVDRHRHECLDLVESNRRVTIAWHRSQGPAWLAALMRSARDPGFRIARRYAGVDRETAVGQISAALRSAGSAELLAALAEHAPALSTALLRGDSWAEIVESWEESRLPVG